MATRSAALATPPTGTARRARPAAKPARPARARLGVVDRRRLEARASRRQATALFALSGVVLALALAVAAAGHALLAADQIQADTLQSQVATAIGTQQNLELERAQLERPGRVLTIAEDRLKMIEPHSVTYLQPVDPGETVAQAHAPAVSQPALRHHTTTARAR